MLLPSNDPPHAMLPQELQYDSRWPGRVVRDTNNVQRLLLSRGVDPRNNSNNNDDLRLFGFNLMQGNNNEAANALPQAAVASNSNNNAVVGSSTDKNQQQNSSDVFSNIKKLEDPIEILFARAEGLHAHGHITDASRLAVQLAKELLAHPPNLMIDLPTPPRGKRKKVCSIFNFLMLFNREYPKKLYSFLD